jgi:hypothetical protein
MSHSEFLKLKEAWAKPTATIDEEEPHQYYYDRHSYKLWNDFGDGIFMTLGCDRPDVTTDSF